MITTHERDDQPLLDYAIQLTGNAETALDVLQDVWVRVFRGIRGLKDPASLGPRLYRVTHGLAVDRIRRHVARDKAEETHVAMLHDAASATWLRFGSAGM